MKRLENTKITMVILFFTIAAFSYAWAGDTYYVDPVSGSDATGAANNINTPYKTLNKVDSLAKNPGDTVILRGGTYADDYFWFYGSGTEAEPITLQAYPGETPIINGVGYYDVIINIGWKGNSHIIIDGLHFQNTTGTVITINSGSTYNTITNCSFYNHAGGNMVLLKDSQYNVVNNCNFDTVGSPADSGSHEHVFILGGQNNLVENNFLTRAGHYSISISESPSSLSYYNVIRNNRIEQHWGGGIGLTKNSHHCLIEGNEVYYIGEQVVGYPKTGIHVVASENIVRKNIVGWSSKSPFSNSGMGLGAYVFQGLTQNNRSNRIYNNIVYKCGNQAVSLKQKDNASLENNIFLNNIFYYNKLGGADIYFYDSNISFETYHSYSDNKWSAFANGNRFSNNIILHADESGDYPNFEDLIYYDGEGIWLKSLAEVESEYPSAFSNNYSLAPYFVDATTTAFNFQIQSNSPAIDNGVFLTETTTAGTNTTTVPVDDAGFFTDGFGVISADQIQIGNNPPVSLTAVDYNTNTITLSSAITFNLKDPVSLPYSGNHPDIGVFEYTGEMTNTAPVLAAIGSKSIEEGQLLSFTVSATDPEGHPITYSANPLPEGAEFNTSSRQFSWTPTAGQAALYDITFRAFDGQLSDSEGVTITVTPASGDITAPEVTNRTVSGISETSAQISWDTDENTSGALLCDKNSSNLDLTNASFQQTSSQASATSHTISLSGLSSGSQYYYCILAEDEAGNLTETEPLSFITSGLAAPGEPTVVAFQNGSDDYTGQIDFVAKGSSPDTHETSIYYLTANSFDITEDYGSRPFFKFDLTSIPSNAIINEAQLTLDHYYISGTLDANLHRVTTAVDYTSATRNTRDGSTPWSGGLTGGGNVEDPDNDFLDTPDDTVTLTTTGTATYIVKDSVQGWISGDVPNNGWLVTVSAAGTGQTRIRPSSYSDVEKRPRLTVIYELPVEDTTPPAPPAVNTVSSPTSSNPLSIGGSKTEDATMVKINGSTTGVTLPTATTWEANVALVEGNNTIYVTAVDEAGNESTPVEISVMLDQDPPTAEIVVNN